MMIKNNKIFTNFETMVRWAVSLKLNCAPQTLRLVLYTTTANNTDKPSVVPLTDFQRFWLVGWNKCSAFIGRSGMGNIGNDLHKNCSFVYLYPGSRQQHLSYLHSIQQHMVDLMMFLVVGVFQGCSQIQMVCTALVLLGWRKSLLIC